MPNPLLRLSDVRRHFGGVRAVDGVSLDVGQGEVYGLIGPNGAGKTTLVNIVTGYMGADSGAITFDDHALTGLSPHRVAALGVARTFQNIRLYRELTATENVVAGMHLHRRHDTLRQVLVARGLRAERAARDAEAARLLALVGLEPEQLSRRRAATLAYGDQRRLEIARALALRPRLLILDEPTAGMNPPEKDRIRALLRELSSSGLTVLLIDHDMRLVMSVCHRLAVLDFGRKIAEGTPDEVSADPSVLRAYLGTGAVEGQQAPAGSASAGTTGAAAPAPSPEANRPRPAHPREGTLLEVEDLEVRYGAVAAVDGVSFTVAEGEVVALVGANGAGKSTILNTLSGLVRPRRGRASFDGLDLTRASPTHIVHHGLVQVPEGREILARLTVRENLELAAQSRGNQRRGNQNPGNRGRAASDIAGYEERFPILGQRRHLPAGQLSGGEQQLLAIARGLVARPRLLLLDEPSLGLAPQLVDTIFEVVDEISRGGLTILLVEQNAYRALELADRAYVVETGRISLSGPAATLRQDPEVQRAYLGG